MHEKVQWIQNMGTPGMSAHSATLEAKIFKMCIIGLAS